MFPPNQTGKLPNNDPYSGPATGSQLPDRSFMLITFSSDLTRSLPVTVQSS